MSPKQTAGRRHGSATVTVQSDTEVLVSRVFDAPAALIFKAYTTPELVPRWYGFETSEWVVCEIDLRVGGQWRFVTRDGGFEVGFHGEYREIDPPHRLVSTEIFEGMPDDVIVDAQPRDDGFDLDPDVARQYPSEAAVNTLTLNEVDGVTTMNLLIEMPSKAARDAMLASGMEDGMQISYNRLDDLATEMAAAS